MSKITNIKQIYWEEEMEHGDERMIFELEDGRKMELAVYGGAEGLNGEDCVTEVHFQEI